MSIKSTIAAVAASPFLFTGAAFAGPYVNLEATGSYPDGTYTSGGLEAVVGYEGTNTWWNRLVCFWWSYSDSHRIC